jgi:hypothetical protein
MAPLITDPGVGLIGDFGNNQKVVPAEAFSALPLVRFSILIGSGKSDIVEGVFADAVLPDAGFDGAQADFVDGTVTVFWTIVHGWLLSFAAWTQWVSARLAAEALSRIRRMIPWLKRQAQS